MPDDRSWVKNIYFKRLEQYAAIPAILGIRLTMGGYDQRKLKKSLQTALDEVFPR